MESPIYPRRQIPSTGSGSSSADARARTFAKSPTIRPIARALSPAPDTTSGSRGGPPPESRATIDTPAGRRTTSAIAHTSEKTACSGPFQGPTRLGDEGRCRLHGLSEVVYSQEAGVIQTFADEGSRDVYVGVDTKGARRVLPKSLRCEDYH